jgi:hypothetical protein
MNAPQHPPEPIVEPGTASGWPRRLREAVLLPLLALLFAEAIIVAAAGAASVHPLRGATYARYDSYHYVSIASRGYFIEEENGLVVGGNVGWFPGYPLVIRAVAPRRVTLAKVGKVVSTVFAFLLLAVLWRVLRGQEGLRTRALSLLLAAVFPGFIYYHTVFPIGMVAWLDLLALVLCARGRYLAAGFLGALGAFSYPTGFLVAVPLTAAVLLDRETSVRARVLALLQGPVVVGLGLVAVSLYQARTVGWNAFLRIRKEYFDNTVSSPLANFLTNTEHVWKGNVQPEALPHLQTVFVALLVLVITAFCWRQRETMTRLDWLLLTNTLIFWVFPQLIGVHGATRADALLVGMVPLLARLPPGARAFLLAIFVTLGAGMCVIFFTKVLV